MYHLCYRLNTNYIAIKSFILLHGLNCYYVQVTEFLNSYKIFLSYMEDSNFLELNAFASEKDLNLKHLVFCQDRQDQNTCHVVNFVFTPNQ